MLRQAVVVEILFAQKITTNTLQNNDKYYFYMTTFLIELEGLTMAEFNA